MSPCGSVLNGGSSSADLENLKGDIREKDQRIQEYCEKIIELQRVQEENRQVLNSLAIEEAKLDERQGKLEETLEHLAVDVKQLQKKERKIQKKTPSDSTSDWIITFIVVGLVVTGVVISVIRYA